MRSNPAWLARELRSERLAYSPRGLGLDGWPVSEIRRVAVAVSAEALMHQWARQESASAGSALVVDTEISARLRGGVIWRNPEPLAASVLARPAGLDPSGADLAWLAASLGAARALDAAGGRGHELGADGAYGPDTARALDAAGGREHCCEWPDTVLAPGGAEVVVNAVCVLGPGRVDYAILTARLGPVAAFDPQVGADGMVGELRAAARLLNEPDELVAAYRRRCATVGCTAAVALLPHGAARGTVRGIDADGRLEIESPTGMVERIAVSSFSSLRKLDD